MNESTEIPSAWRRSRVVCQETDCSSSAAVLGQECVTCAQIHALPPTFFFFCWLYHKPMQPTFELLHLLLGACFHFREHTWMLSPQHLSITYSAVFPLCYFERSENKHPGFYKTVCACVFVWKISLCADPSPCATVFMSWLPYHLTQPHTLNSYTCLREPVMDKEGVIEHSYRIRTAEEDSSSETRICSSQPHLYFVSSSYLFPPSDIISSDQWPAMCGVIIDTINKVERAQKWDVSSLIECCNAWEAAMLCFLFLLMSKTRADPLGGRGFGF